jgi:hypothetical protein
MITRSMSKERIGELVVQEMLLGSGKGNRKIALGSKN